MHASCLILLSYFIIYSFGIRQGKFQLWNRQALGMQAVHLLITSCAHHLHNNYSVLNCLVLYLLQQILKIYLKCKQNRSPLSVPFMSLKLSVTLFLAEILI